MNYYMFVFFMPHGLFILRGNKNGSLTMNNSEDRMNNDKSKKRMGCYN